MTSEGGDCKVRYVVWGSSRKSVESAADRFADLPEKIRDQILREALDWMGITARPLNDEAMVWLREFLSQELAPEFIEAVLCIMGQRAEKTHEKEGTSSIYAEAME